METYSRLVFVIQSSGVASSMAMWTLVFASSFFPFEVLMASSIFGHLDLMCPGSPQAKQMISFFSFDLLFSYFAASSSNPNPNPSSPSNTFFVSITRDLQLLMGVNIPQKDKHNLAKAVRMVAASHEARGYHVSGLLFDGEAGIAAARAEIESLGIRLDLASTGEHVPRIERANRQIKERVRAVVKPKTPKGSLSKSKSNLKERYA